MSKKQVGDYILDKRIGKGSYATVWKGHVAGSGDVVAIKVVSRQTVTESAQLRQEVDVLRRIMHPNIVRFVDLKKTSSHYYLVLEYCTDGDLSQLLQERGRVPEATAKMFLSQIAAGLYVLHRENVIHRDLKPQNILLSGGDEAPVLKIADFGFARALQPQDMADTVCGSPLYMAPEILRHEPYDCRADMWSVGAILYELLMGRPPFSGANPMQLLANIEKNDEVILEGKAAEEVSGAAQEFLRSLLMRNPARRLGSLDFMRHPYVQLATPPEAPLKASPPSESASSPTEASRAVAMDAVSERTSPGSGCQSPIDDEAVAFPAIADASEVSRQTSNGSLAQGVCSTPPSRGRSDSGPSGPSWGGIFAEPYVSSTGRQPRAWLAHEAPAATQRGCSAGSAEPMMRGVQSMPVSGSRARAGASSPAAQPKRPRQRPSRAEDEYVLITEKRPIPGRARKAGTAGRKGDYCSNLSRTAHTLEFLASRDCEQFPADALALLLQALGLLHKALSISVADEEVFFPLRTSFARMCEAAEEARKRIHNVMHSEAQDGIVGHPHSVIWDFAIQQAKDAAIGASKGIDVGGWEDYCQEKLSSALLLLEFLRSEADAEEDLSNISSYIKIVSDMLEKVEQRMTRRQGG